MTDPGVRVCPDCELEATRRPELDTATQIAFRCQSHWHKPVFEAAPKVEPPVASPAEPVAEPKARVKKVAVAEPPLTVEDASKDKA